MMINCTALYLEEWLVGWLGSCMCGGGCDQKLTLYKNLAQEINSTDFVYTLINNNLPDLTLYLQVIYLGDDGGTLLE